MFRLHNKDRFLHGYHHFNYPNNNKTKGDAGGNQLRLSVEPAAPVRVVQLIVAQKLGGSPASHPILAIY